MGSRTSQYNTYLDRHDMWYMGHVTISTSIHVCEDSQPSWWKGLKRRRFICLEQSLGLHGSGYEMYCDAWVSIRTMIECSLIWFNRRHDIFPYICRLCHGTVAYNCIYQLSFVTGLGFWHIWSHDFILHHVPCWFLQTATISLALGVHIEPWSRSVAMVENMLSW